MVKNGYDQKLAVSQLWIDGVKGFFAYWSKFRKAKSYFNNFWVGMAKNGHDGVLVHSKICLSREWIGGLGWFFACW